MTGDLRPAGKAGKTGKIFCAFLKGRLPAKRWSSKKEGCLEEGRPLSQNKKWSGSRDSNPGPHAPKACALASCATPRKI